jgi:ABC-type uncharacterized transport system involved in gliding motility auxiliary subunit
MQRRFWSSLIGVIAVAAIVVGINMFADARLANVHADLTEQHLYTLSSGTRQVLRGLKDPITLRLFYSPRLGTEVPIYGTYADHVREMLEQYAAISGGKVRLEFFDPEPFSDVEDRALAYGLQGVPLDRSGEQVYFGIAGTNLLDDERNIPFLQPDRERFLEYDLTKLVYELSNPQRPVVGVMSSLPIDGDPRMMMMAMRQGSRAGAPWLSMVQLRQSDQIKQVPVTAQVIDPDIQVLLVAQAQNLSDATQYAIDQFVMRGGRLMVMVDPYSEAEASTPGPEGMPAMDVSSDLKKLFDAWGIVFDPTKVVADLNGAWRVRANPSDRVSVVDYVPWFNIRDGINHNDPATADLQQITVASAGFISKKEGAAIEFTPLLTTTAEAGVLPVNVVRDPDPARVLADFKPSGGARVVAARIRGVLKSAFTGPPELPKGEKRPDNFPAFKAETDGPANIVVVADTDILADRFWVRVQDFFGQQEATPFSDNGPFLANLVGTLAGGDALIGLRSRGDTLRPFELVDRIQKQAEAQFRQKQQALQQHLQDVEKQLAQLRQGGGQGTQTASAVITAEQSSAIDAARRDVLDTRKQLRAVQLNLNREISALKTELQLFNIALVPALLTLIAIVLGVARSRRRARARV